MKTHVLGRKSEKNRPTRKTPKLSPDARRLILATVRRCKSERKAATVLKLRSHVHLGRMLRGEMSETPEMRAAVIRARARAARAFIMAPRDAGLDLETVERLKRLLVDAEWVIQVARNAIE